MCDYIIKHYWDENTNSATLKPEWLTSGESLSKDQEKIKTIYLQTLGDASYYNNLSKMKPTEEDFSDYVVSYTYKDKVDPLHKGTKSRNATDITMCINKKKKNMYGGKNVIVVLIVVILLILGWQSFSDNQKIIVKTKESANPQEKHREVRSSIKNVERKKDTVLSNVCNEESSNLRVKNPEKCWEYYVMKRCNGKTDDSFKEWFKRNENICEKDVDHVPLSSAIEADNKIPHDYIRNEVYEKSNTPVQINKIKKFFQGGKNGTN